MGLDESGKTALLNNYIHGEVFNPSPSDLSSETPYSYKNRKYRFREIGGRYRFREDWPTLYEGAKAVIWVVDSIDRGRIIESKEELDKILVHEHLANLPLLIALNKQDSHIKMEYNLILEKLATDQINRNIKISLTTARDASSFTESMDWIVEQTKCAADVCM